MNRNCQIKDIHEMAPVSSDPKPRRSARDNASVANQAKPKLQIISQTSPSVKLDKETNLAAVKGAAKRKRSSSTDRANNLKTKRAHLAAHASAASEDLHTNRPVGKPSFASLPAKILHQIFYHISTHPNHLFRAMLVSRTIYDAIKTHPLWRTLLVRWKIPFKEPTPNTKSDYFLKWRRDVAKCGKKHCELCLKGGSETKLPMGQSPTGAWLQRMCIDCFSASFVIFKETHRGEAKYAESRIKYETLDKGASLKMVKLQVLGLVGHTVTWHKGPFGDYMRYNYPEYEILMLRDFCSPVSSL
ncbi:hypothetical protein HDU98_000652 [Podochytrium sp. JEL0797]|nr:hypothetical protein HDU98_000652 [Podochytrium sp. JEL0797]